ncbi:uncharacterized protein LOC134228806 [Saccostrea cucullata]|uniref:uncharacterized protein LOC134228806 n=1 Tax=Saccostrea cuccullata TaxID=36930 RepID=UPI002ED104A8
MAENARWCDQSTGDDHSSMASDPTSDVLEARRCQSGFSDARSIKVCVYFTGIYSVFDGHKECSQLNSELINIRSDVEEDLLETLMCSLFDDDNKSNANKAYIQGRWNGTHWVLDDGKAMEHSMQWTTNTDLSKLQYGDRLSFYPKGHKIAINNGNLARPIFCAYDIV